MRNCRGLQRIGLVVLLVPIWGISGQTSAGAARTPHGQDMPQTIAEFSDFNGDGYADVAMGDYGEDVVSGVDQPNAGAVNVLYGSPCGIQASVCESFGRADQFLTQDFTTHDQGDTPEGGDRFGRSLATGDFNGDSYADLAISADMEDVTNMDAGVVHVVYGTSSGLQVTSPADQYWYEGFNNLSGDAEESDLFGRGLVAGDFDGSGQDDLAIGVPGQVVGEVFAAGSVHVIYGSSAGLDATGTSVPDDQVWSQDSMNVEEVAEDDDDFGEVLAAGRFNTDSFADLAIGVFLEDLTVTDAGVLQVIHGSSNGLQAVSPADQLWTQDQLDAGGGGIEPQDRFGRGLAAANYGKTSNLDLAVGAALLVREDPPAASARPATRSGPRTRRGSRTRWRPTTSLAGPWPPATSTAMASSIWRLVSPVKSSTASPTPGR